jgi:hypothetical protein
LGAPHEPTADRTAQLQTVAGYNLLREIRRDFPIREPFDGYFNAPLVGRGGDRIRPDRGVSVQSHQTHVNVLARDVTRPIWDFERDRPCRRRFVAKSNYRSDMPHHSPE